MEKGRGELGIIIVACIHCMYTLHACVYKDHCNASSATTILT